MGKENSATEGHAARLGTSALLRDLPPELLADLAKRCAWRSVGADETVLGGEPDGDHGVFIVLSGTVEVYQQANQAERLALGRVDAGGCFGEFAAIVEPAGSARVRAVEPTELAEIPKQVFLDLLHEQPQLMMRLLERLISLARSLNERVTQLESVGRDITRIQSALFIGTM